jgi:hypothetical protein
MSRKPISAYFIRIAGVIAVLSLFATACDLPQAPRFPEDQEQDEGDDDDA